jgi:16S rRNA (guanine966-N2)-methyltransferase
MKPSGEVRIIGGQWKRSKLPVPPVPGLRPTPDRVRETLFNWLGQDLTGLRCVDAFAGSGALGFEAASRGAAQVRLFEQDRALVQGMRANAQRLHASALTIETGDAVRGMQSLPPGAWDVVFLDPPFTASSAHNPTAQPALPAHNDPLFRQALAAAQPLLVPGGVVYLEAPRAWTDHDLAPLGLVCVKKGRAGQVHYHLLQRLALQSG